MRVVLDTNVLIAAFITRGICHDIFEHCARYHELVTSRFILQEFRRTLVGKFRMSKKDVTGAVVLLKSRLVEVEPSRFDKKICRDPDDDHILGTALSGQAHCVVSGDRDLTDLKRFRNIDLISPRDFWSYEHSKS